MFLNVKMKSKIAVTIGKHRSVITGHIQRNCDKRNGKYDYDLAQRNCEKRHEVLLKAIRLTQSIKEHIALYQDKKFSLEQIAGVAIKEGIACVSYERIYQYIWDD